MDLKKGALKMKFREGFPKVDPKGKGKSHQQEVFLVDNKEILWETKLSHREGMKKASKVGLEV